MAGESVQVTAEVLRNLEAGQLSWTDVEKILRSEKTTDRFQEYQKVLRENANVRGEILLRLNEHLVVVLTPDGAVNVQCMSCGQDFGDYRVNWKLQAAIYVRRTLEEFMEVYTYEEVAPTPGYCEVREYYCPGCYALLAVEAVPPGYPPVFEFLPDIPAFYEGVLNQKPPGGLELRTDDRTYEFVREHWASRSGT